MEKELIYKEITEKIIGFSFEVYNELGYGFLEKVYENALVVLFREAGMKAEQQKKVPVYFREYTVGEYVADILVENKITLEIKASDILTKSYYAQILNYLKATNLRLGVLLHFAPKKLFYQRIIN